MSHEQGMDHLVDKVWNTFLDTLKKREVPPVRVTLGDEINLLVPQIRVLIPMYANPRLPASLYTASYLSARRNAYAIMRKLDMPPDFFWKFEFWTRERAFEVLGKVSNRIFREIMRTTGEGLLDLENVATSANEIKIVLKLQECVECAGLEASRPLCYYHAGTLAGIISAMLGKELDGYETDCGATGGQTCEFVVSNKARGQELDRYLNPEKIDFSIQNRLENALSGERSRSLGNDASLRYYHLILLNSLITNPKMFSASSYEVGVTFGEKLALFLMRYYHKTEAELFEAITHYYSFLKHLKLELKREAGEIRAEEIAEISGLAMNEDFLGFLFGEFAGLLSVIRKERMAYREYTFEDHALVVRFKKEA